MALTLPYPGLVFVPLDILTAEEQNEIVANYTYIASQFPIQSSNIDFTTISYTSTPVAIGSIGNKTIYRRVITSSTGSSINSWKNIAEIPNITNIISIKGNYSNAGQSYSIDSNHDLEFYVETSGTPVLRERHSDSYFNNMPLELVIEYY